jgi:hypothetical protein
MATSRSPAPAPASRIFDSHVRKQKIPKACETLRIVPLVTLTLSPAHEGKLVVSRAGLLASGVRDARITSVTFADAGDVVSRPGII